jgi:tRNA U34 5-methylaminomethyl-2-thiouridine-forming methyltransferase MnmC
MEGIKIFTTNDGSHTLQSEQFGVSYHSVHGAIRESNHVFIQNGLRMLTVLGQKVRILELGFGTGLNAFLTYLESVQRDLRVYYQTIEAYPINIQLVHQLNYPQLLNATEFQKDFLQLHQVDWDKNLKLGATFRFQKRSCKFEDIDYTSEFDIVYFDAFGPAAQPELWTLDMMKKVHQALRKEGVLVTYCAQGQFKRHLKELGFVVERLPGPPGKREMTRAIKL